MVLLTKNMAIDYGGRGIRVNAVCPGFVETPMTVFFFGPGAWRRRWPTSCTSTNWAGAWPSPGRSLPSPRSLLSDDASFVTGHALPVDGGYTAGRDHGVTDMLGVVWPRLDLTGDRSNSGSVTSLSFQCWRCGHTAANR